MHLDADVFGLALGMAQQGTTSLFADVSWCRIAAHLDHVCDTRDSAHVRNAAGCAMALPVQVDVAAQRYPTLFDLNLNGAFLQPDGPMQGRRGLPRDVSITHYILGG